MSGPATQTHRETTSPERRSTPGSVRDATDPQSEMLTRFFTLCFSTERPLSSEFTIKSSCMMSKRCSLVNKYNKNGPFLQQEHAKDFTTKEDCDLILKSCNFCETRDLNFFRQSCKFMSLQQKFCDFRTKT